MKRRLAVIFVLIVTLPLGVFGWLGARVAHNEREAVRQRFREILVERLKGVDGSIAEVLAGRERELLSQAGLAISPAEALRDTARRSATVRQFFVLDGEGRLLYPAPSSSLTDEERAFVRRTERIWLDGEIPGPGGEDGSAAGTEGWYAWYWDKGLQLIFWWRDGDAIMGAELNRARLLADIVAALPVTEELSSYAPPERIVLRDEQGGVLYQWGVYSPADGESALASLPLSPPLSAWTLEYCGPSEFGKTAFGGFLWNVASGLAALVAVFIGLAAYFYRESTRELREAAQRVSFVNQVSHELKTPLTSIRMYAEMLGEEIDEEDERPRRHLHVIVAESQRLSRLINNVLTFSRKQRSALKLRPVAGNADRVIEEVVGHFQEPLAAKGIRIAFTPGAGREACFDPDALQQIVGNLLNNVEKYAQGADCVVVESRQEGDHLHVAVADNGPGIPRKERERVFRPFYRISDKLTDGVAGTGIGLSIARDLARLHGGDLVLEPAEKGARFVLTLHATACDSGEEQ